MISVTNLQDRLEVGEAWVEDVAAAVLRAEGIPSLALSVVLVDDDRIRDLHRRFLGVDDPTDVLAFPLAGDGAIDAIEGSVAGEVVVSAERALAVGGAEGAGAELALYIAHGVLHLLGYRDRTAEEARAMHERACAILEPLGLRPAPL